MSSPHDHLRHAYQRAYARRVGSAVALAIPKGYRWLSICRRYTLIRILTVLHDAPQVVTLVDNFVSCLRPSRARALPAL